MVSRFLNAILVCLVWVSLATANAGDCYWFIRKVDSAWGDPRIRVIYQSGHTSVRTVGDYLPVGCNVVGYQFYGNHPDGCFAELVSPQCVANGQQILFMGPWTAFESQDGKTMPSLGMPGGGSIQPFCHGSCGSCVDEEIPTEWDPDGDDDGDGVRNECDPDSRPGGCPDVDGNGCCDFCADDCTQQCEGKPIEDCNPCPDVDVDGRCDNCDPEHVDCVDNDENGCCDHCSPEDCEEQCSSASSDYPDCCIESHAHADCKCTEDKPTFPNCCMDGDYYPGTDDCENLCEEDSPGWPNCCGPGHPDYPVCCHGNPDSPYREQCEEDYCNIYFGSSPTDCVDAEGVPTYDLASGKQQCCLDNPDHPNYPDCPCKEDDCGLDCDPCAKLDQLIALSQQIAHNTKPANGSGTDPIIGTPDTAPPLDALPVPVLPIPYAPGEGGGGSTAPSWAISIPIPNREPVVINLSNDITLWGLPSTLVTVVETLRAVMWSLGFCFCWYRYARALLKLIGAL